MLLQMVLFHSFLWPSVFSLDCSYPKLHYSIVISVPRLGIRSFPKVPMDMILSILCPSLFHRLPLRAIRKLLTFWKEGVWIHLCGDELWSPTSLREALLLPPPPTSKPSTFSSFSLGPQ